MTREEILTDAMRRMQAGEKLTYTDKEVELIMLGWHAELQKAVAAEREACEERVVSLFEVLETPYLPDITRAIRARGTP